MRRLSQLVLLLSLLALGVSPGLHAQSLVQSRSWAISSTITFNNTTAPGNTYVLMASGDYMNGGRFTGVPTDSEGNTWTKVVDTVSPNSKLEQIVWQALSVKGGTNDAITISTNACCSTNMILAELHNASYLDQSAQQGNTSTSTNGATSPAITTAELTEIILGFGSTSPANGSGFTGNFQAGFSGFGGGSQFADYEVTSSVQSGIAATGTVISGSDNDSVVAIIAYAPNSPFPIAPAITSASSANFTAGKPGSFQVNATGYPTPTLGESGTFPSGVTFNTTTGILSGTPGAGTAGSYPITFTAQNGVGSGASQSFTLIVNMVPTFVQGTYEDDTPAVFAQTTMSGDTYVLQASSDYMNGGRFTGLPTDTEGNTCWKKILDTLTPDNKVEQAIYVCIGVIGGTKDSVLPSTNGCCGQNAELVELRNAAYIDQMAQQANSTAGAVSSPTITTTQPAEVILGMGLTSPANGSGWQSAVQTGYTGVAIGSQYGAYEAVSTIQSNIAATASVVAGIDNDSLMAIVTVAATAPGGAPTIITANSTTFTVGTAGSFSVTAIAAPAPTLSETGTLPSGVTFNAATGKLSGTPAATAGGIYPITFTAQNTGGTTTQSFTLTVNQAPAITSATSATFSIGAASSFTVTATGTPSPTLSESGTLPSGVTFNGATGVLSGTPATGSSGTYPLTITAQNGVGANATQSFTLTVNQAPVITSANNASFTAGISNSFTVTVAGIPVPTLSESGTLPSGVTFVAASGLLSGTPAMGTAGSYPLTFTAQNGIGTGATQTFTLQVLSQAPALTSPNNASFTVGSGGTFAVTATGLPAPTLSESGALPSGVTFDASTGVLSGTPVGGTNGTYSITFSAQNIVGPTATQNFTLIVNQALLVPTFVQTVSWAISPTVTFNNNTAAGNTYVLMASGDYMNGGRFTGVPHDTEGNTWTKIVDTVSPNSKLEQIVWQALNVKGGTKNAITISTNGCCSTNMILAELHNASYLDQYAQQGNTSTATNGATSPAVTTAVGTEIMLGYGSTSPANGSGFTGNFQAGFTGFGGGSQFADYQNVTSVQNGVSTTGSVISGGDNDSLIAIVTYAAASPSVAPTIVSFNNTTFSAGTFGSFNITAIATPTPTYAESGTLPSGVAFNTATGVLSGTPVPGAGGTYAVTFGAQNGVVPNASQSFTLTVDQAPAITSAASATFTAGTPGSFVVAGNGIPAPTFAETGALPSGVTFNTSTGVLSGTPAAGTGGTYTISFAAQNGVVPNATQTFTLTVNQAPAIGSANSSTFTVGTAGSFTVTASGTPASTLTESGALPSGVTFSAGVLSGAPGAGTTGSYPITFTAQNGIGANATQSFTLTVNQAPAITSSNSTLFTAGAAGSFTVTGTGVPAPTFSESGALPSGVTFNAATGTLSGTPAATTGGSYPITFTAQNGVGSPATQSFTVSVTQAPAIISLNSATYPVGALGSFTVSATGTPAPTFSESGALPSGVTFSNAGVLSGTPAAGTVGNYPITVTAQNGVGAAATQSFTLTIDQSAAITSANSVAFTAGTAGSFTVAVTGVPTPTLSESGALPSGVTFVATTGVLSGTATSGGTFPIVFTAQNGVGANVTQNFTLTVSQAPAITSAASTTFSVGTAASFNVTATGTPAPTLSETGALPSGVTFTNAGVLSGTAAAATTGSYPISITAQNGVGTPVTQSFTLTVNQAPAIGSANNTTFTLGVAGSFTVTATGVPAVTLSESGTLPSGVTFNTATGVLSGTTSVSGNFPITFTAQNGVGSGATQSFTLSVNQPPAIVSSAAMTFTVGTPGTFTVTAAGAPTPTLAESGTLPSGVTFNAGTGVLSGIPAQGTGGVYPLVFTAQNGVGSNAAQSFVLSVNQPPASPTFVQSVIWDFSPTIVFNNATAAGDAYILMASGDYMNGGRFTGLPTDTEGNTWTKLVDTVSPNSKLEQIVWQALNVKGGTKDAITIATNGCCSTNMVLVELHNATYFDQAAQQGGTSTASMGAISPAVTTTLPTEIVLGFGSTSPANGSGFSLPVQTGYTGIAVGGQYAAYATVSSLQTGITATATVVAGGDNDSLMAIVTYAGAPPTIPPTITSVNSAKFTAGTLGSFSATAVGTPTPAFTETGALPTGVTFNAAGVLFGTPAANTVGTYPLTITAQNGVGANAVQTFTLTVNQAPAITSAASATFTAGTAGSFTIAATGSPVPTLSQAGTLPSGVSFNPATGVLGGTPAATTGGTYAISFTAQNGVGTNATQSFVLTVNQAPAIGSAASTTFTVGASGSFTATATGTPAATFLEAGSLPTGVTFSAAGVLSGTPAANTTGSYPITITAQNGVAPNATQSFTLSVNQGSAITSAATTSFTAGTSGSFTVTATGVPAPALSESGTLPSGVTFTPATGVLGGTPAIGGTYSISFTAQNGVGSSTTQSFTLNVNQAPAITSSSSATFAIGAASSFIVSATGMPASTFSESGALPSGVTFTSAGVLSGTPAAGTIGNYPIGITAQNGVGTNATQSFTLTVNQSAAITSASSASFTVGASGSFTVTATGVPAPALSESGALPSGVTFNNTTGVLGGTPAASTGGTYSITFTAQNGVGANATQTFTLTVGQAPAITSLANATFSVGSVGSFVAAASGSPAPTFSESGSLPSGVSFNTAGVLSGTPAVGTTGSYPFTITAQNGVGTAATQSFTLTVNQPPAITSVNTTNFTLATLDTFTVTATGSPAPTLSESGALPAGVTFNSATGVLSGTPSTGGVFSIAFTAQNGVGAGATQTFTLSVGQAPAISSAATVSFTVGTPGTFTVSASGNPTPAISESGTLPSGVTFTSVTGTLSGTPAAGTSGSYPVTFTAQNGVGTAATQSFTLSVTQTASPTMVQSIIWDFSPTVTFNNTTGAGNTYVLMASGDYMNGGRFTGLPADTEGNTWTKIVDTISPNNKLEQIVWQAVNAKGGTQDAITLATNRCCSTNIVLVELHNAAYFDQGAQQGGTSTASMGATSPAVTTTQPAEIMLGFGSTSPANGSGFSLPVQTGYTGIAVGGQYGGYSTVGAIQTGATATATVVAGGDNDSLMAIITYAAATPGASPVITSANNTKFTVATAGTFAVTSVASPAATYFETGTLPTGVTFSPATGLLGGTPAAATGGTYPISITAQNGVGVGNTQSFTLNVSQAPAITTAASANFAVGVTGSFNVAATGVPAPALSESGTLPSGVTFNSATGVLSGAPTSGGIYTLTFTAQNGVGNNATQSFTLTVGQAPAITSAAAATFTVGTAGSFTMAATGAPVPTLSMSGTLPSGVTFNTTTGTLSGTPAPSTAGTYAITLSAQNGVGAGANQSFTLSVNQASGISSGSSAIFVAGTAGSFTVTATGTPSPTLSESGALPSGVTFNAATGVLGGTAAPTTGGTYAITFTAQNGVGAAATQSFTLTVNQAPAITSTNSATFIAGTAGSFTVNATGIPSATLSESGALPSGVTFTPATGVLSGTPAATTGGTYPITFTAQNGVGTAATQTFTLSVNQPPAITSANNTTFTAGTAGSFTVIATGVPSSTLSESGALPSGVTFNAATGALAGTPGANAGGVYPISFTAQNGVGTSATQSFTLTVNQAPVISSAATTTFVIGAAGSFTVTDAGTPTPTYSVSGTLPSGITLTSAGVLAGTPAAGTAGSYPVTITAQNGVGAPAMQSFTLVINQAPAITSAATATFTVGAAGSFSVTATGTPAPAFSETGALPSGVTFSTAGVFSGTAAASTTGNYPITITAQNGVGTSATQSFTLIVNQAPAISSVTSATFVVGTAGLFTVTASGVPAPAISESGTLPSGVTFNPATGLLSGTPAAGTIGSYPVTFTAQNGVGTAATQSFTLTVNQAPAITSATLTTFTAGTLGSFTVTTTGTPAPTLSESGVLPSGVTFTAATGVLSGTPAATTGGTYTITFTAQNGVGTAATQSFTLTVNQAPAFSSAASATFVVGTSSSFAVTASAMPAATLSESGALPSGLTFNAATGALSGTPGVSTAGSYPVVFTAQNGIGAAATQNFTVTVNQTAAITSAITATFTVGTAGSFPVTTIGSPAPTLSVSGVLPSGVTFNAATGVLSGTPAQGTGANYPLTFTAHNGVGTDAKLNFILTVNQVPAISSVNHTAFTVSAAGTFTTTASGYPAPVISESGALPSGVTFNSTTGVLSGTPAAGTTGNYPITISAQNGIGADAMQNFTLTVNQSAVFTSANTVTFGVATAGTFTVTVAGTPAPSLSEIGSLPSGVTFTPSTGLLSGTPAAGTAGNYVITFDAHNSAGTDAIQSFTLVVGQAPAVTSASGVTFDIATLDSFTVTATGAPAPTLSETGTLPAGVTFNSSTGLLSGTPAAGTTGTYPVVFAAQNGVGTSATQNFTLTVGQGANAPAINSPSNASFVVATPGLFMITASGSPAPALAETGTLPSGVTFNASTGLLSGTPAAGTLGTYPITLTAQNGVGTTATQSFTLTVNSAPGISTSPTNQAVTAGQTATFMVAVTGSAPLTYQWQINGVNIGGATSSSYTTAATTGANSGTQYTVVVGNTFGSVISTAATLTVNTAPAISVPPANQTVAVGQTATFSVSVSVTGNLPLTYQWYKNSQGIPGATSQSYKTPVTTTLDSGSQFTVLVSNSLATVPSAAGTLTVVQPTSPATYYVDFSSGADTNGGISKSAPWKYAPGMNDCSFNCALVTLHPGDQVIFKGGVVWDESGFPMVVTTSGASGSPVYYGVDQTWYAGNAWSRPAFDLNNATWFVAPILTSAANYVTFDSLEIRNEEVDNSGSWPPRGAIAVNGGSNITIQNCYVHGWSIQNPISGSDASPFGGIAFYNGSTGGAVKNCILDGSPESDSGVGIYGGTTIQGNIVENVPNGIVLTNPAAVVSGNQVFAIPYSVDPSVSSYAIFASTSGSINNNFVHDLVAGASGLFLEAGTIELGNTQYVYNNSIWNVGDNSPVVIASDVLGPNSPSNQFIYNNTLVGGTTAGCVSVNPNIFAPTNLTIQNNHCISEEPTSATWCWNQSGSNYGCGPVTNAIFGNNVLMTNEVAAAQGFTAANGFRPAAANNGTVSAGVNLVSSCVTIGSDLCSDLLGVPRPGSTAWDAGAYQYQSVAGSLAPVIVTQPVRQEVTAGLTATFNVNAEGTAQLTYQWMRNGAAISGATSSTYTTPAVAATDDGTLFSVVVANGLGSVTSSPALLSVSATPGQLTSNPASMSFGTIGIGTSNTASVTLTNTSSDYVTVSSVTVSGPGFSVIGAPSGVILASGETATMNVVFAPSGSGTATGSISVASDAAGSPLAIPLSGAGITPLHSASLAWNASGASVFGYNVYQATNQFGPYTKLNSTPTTAIQYTDLTVQSGQTYYYWVTAVAADTLESTLSSPVTAIIP